MTNKILPIALAWAIGAAAAIAEVPLLTKERLKKAPEIVVGKVVKVYRNDPSGSGFRHVDFVAELEVVRVDKGDDVKVGDVIYVHYWNQVGKLPNGWTGSRGHDSKCMQEKSLVRVHLRQDKQSRREILLPNGAEPVDK